MNCNTFKKKLDEYIQGELSVELSTGMKSHKRKCLFCESAYNEEVELNKILEDVFTVEGIQFNSSRGMILKEIDKKKYGKGILTKSKYHLIRNNRIYASVVAIGIVVVIGTSYFVKSLYKGDELHRNNVVLNSKKYEVSTLKNNNMNYLKDEAVYGFGDYDNYKIIVNEDTDDKKVYLELLSAKDNSLIDKVDLSKDFQDPLSFDKPFNIDFQDLNNDGWPEFPIGQKLKNQENYQYNFYSVKGNSIEKIRFDTNQVLGLPIGSMYSPHFKSDKFEVLTIPIKSDEKDEYQEFIWNRKIKEFQYEKNISNEEIKIKLPAFNKEIREVNNQDQDDLIKKISPSKSYFAYLSKNGRYDEDIHIVNGKEESIYKLNDSWNDADLKDITWRDDKELIFILGDRKSESLQGGSLYSLNIDTGETSVVKLNTSEKQLFTSVKVIDEGYQYDMLIYDDNKFSKYHYETGILPFTKGNPMDIRIVN